METLSENPSQCGTTRGDLPLPVSNLLARCSTGRWFSDSTAWDRSPLDHSLFLADRTCVMYMYMYVHVRLCTSLKRSIITEAMCTTALAIRWSFHTYTNVLTFHTLSHSVVLYRCIYVYTSPASISTTRSTSYRGTSYPDYFAVATKQTRFTWKQARKLYVFTELSWIVLEGWYSACKPCTANPEVHMSTYLH